MPRNELGQFVAGPDRDRHAFSRDERRRGYATLMQGGRNGRLPAPVVAFVWRRVRGYYRRLKREGKI